MRDNNQHVQDWVVALRSGDYPQTVGCMKDDIGYCCLGVACALAGVEFVPAASGIRTLDEQNPHGVYRFQHTDSGPGQNERLPEWLAEMLGVSGYDQDELVQFNDASYSFGEIADIIETAATQGTDIDDLPEISLVEPD